MHSSRVVDTDNQLMAAQQGRDLSIRKPCSDYKVPDMFNMMHTTSVRT